MEYNKAAAKISEEIMIKINAREVERILSCVKNTGDLWEIVDYSDVPVPAVFQTLKFLKDENLIYFDEKSCKLTESGLELASGLHPVEDMSCTYCDGRGLSFSRFSDVEKKFNEIQSSRPPASHNFDQGYVTPATSVARFVLAYERGDVKGKDILVLGDDDLVSIVLGLSGLPKSITVVEIDKRLTGFIRETGEKYGFEVNVNDFDLRKPLPEIHVKRYDTFFTDPPETIRAADAFLGRGISALKEPGSAGYFGFTRREASLTKWYDLQRLLLGYGIVITDIIHNFSEYINWGYEEETRAWDLAPFKTLPVKNWYRSALYRIQTLQGFSGSSIDYGDENIYDDHESSTT